MTNSETVIPMAEKVTKGSPTPGPWKTDACGGFSTVVSMTQPMRADTRIGAYGYDPRRGYSIGYPLIEDDGKVKRIDFVCFSHEDARLIAAAPELLAALKAMDTALCDGFDTQSTRMAGRKALIDARAAIAKAEGRS